VVPLPSRTYNNLSIDAIYFDDGVRVMSKNTGTIKDLLKLSNGAKNIYLFSFKIMKAPKKQININLDDNLDPYTAIRDWKRANYLYAYEGEYNKQSRKSDTFISADELAFLAFNGIKLSCTLNGLINIFETENNIYRIVCTDTQPKKDILSNYIKAHSAWLNQCYIQKGIPYQGETIRNKLGRSSRTLYDENGNTHYYKYEEGFFSDEWYIDGNDCCGGGDRWQIRIYYQFLDTTRPPKKPDILDY
jgi:hypothetical protein